MNITENGKERVLRNLFIATSNRSDYIKIKPVLQEMKNREIPFNIVVSGSHLALKQGYTYKSIEKDKFEIKEMLNCQIDGTSLESMSKSVGLSVMEHSHFFAREKPSSIMLVGDRFDIFPVAIAASMMNIPILHIQGGEISGSIDESIRHTITKMSHIHFVSTEAARRRVIVMGEKPETVFNTGCPTVDMLNVLEIEKLTLENLHSKNPVYAALKEKDYFMVLFHPVTTEIAHCGEAMETVLEAVESFGKQIVLIYPNRDAGADSMVDVIMKRSRAYGKYILNRHLVFDDYINLMVNCSVFIGNSSSGIRETGTFGVQTVNIGTRQHMRDRNKNVQDADLDTNEIISAIKKSQDTGRYPSENIYGDGNASKQIVDVLLSLNELRIQKTYHDSINLGEVTLNNKW